MKSYDTIFFDLDHTLWDFETNARETLREMFEHFDLKKLGFEAPDQVISEYEKINESLWVKYRAHEIDKATLRDSRFRMLLELVEHTDHELAANLNTHYLTHCPQKTTLMDGATEVLEELSTKYPLHIISNGFVEAQFVKLKNSGLEQYFQQVILSEEVGHQKPQPGIFKAALDRTNSKKHSSIYIGDHIDTDVKGAINFGMDVVFFNPKEVRDAHNATHEVTHLRELLRIF